MRELKELGAYWHRADERPPAPSKCQRTRGAAVVETPRRKGVTKYLRLRKRFQYRRPATYVLSASSMNQPGRMASKRSTARCHASTRLRAHQHPPYPPVQEPLTSLLTLTISPSEFEQFLSELWMDFLIEPAPYLVAYALCYLGFILLLGKYYMMIWRATLFAAWVFLPSDDAEWILSYP